MKIYLGPAGVPISSPKRDTLTGIRTVGELGLNAIEIQFVRGVKMKREMAEEAREIAEELGIKLSVHAPYYINLASEKKDIIEKSKERILESLDRAEIMDAEFVVVHAAYYLKEKKDKEIVYKKKETYEIVKKNIEDILDKMKERGIKKAKLALETMAKEAQFAGLEELLKLIDEINHKQLTICVDFAHLYARNNGKINYKKILDELEKRNIKRIHCHFSNMRYNVNTKRFLDIHEPIDGNPPFEPLAKELLKRDFEEVTIISESPILEKDALKMKKIFEKLGYKFE